MKKMVTNWCASCGNQRIFLTQLLEKISNFFLLKFFIVETFMFFYSYFKTYLALLELLCDFRKKNNQEQQISNTKSKVWANIYSRPQSSALSKNLYISELQTAHQTPHDSFISQVFSLFLSSSGDNFKIVSEKVIEKGSMSFYSESKATVWHKKH